MKEPSLAANTPTVMELEPGTYYWCSCGLSAKQPFCDGSHKGTDFSPGEFVVEKKKRFALCRCKRTETPPLCDGSHTKF